MLILILLFTIMMILILNYSNNSDNNPCARATAAGLMAAGALRPTLG